MLKTSLICLVGFALSLVGAEVALASEAFSVPISDQVVDGRLVLPGGEAVTFALREGAMVTVRDEVSGTAEGWVVILNSGQPSFTPVHITPINFSADGRKKKQSREDKASQLGEAVLVPLGDTEIFRMPSGEFQVESNAVRLGDFSSIRRINPRGSNPQVLQKVYSSGGGNCCVTCGSITICATEVDMTCGSCSAIGGGGPRTY